MKRIAFLLVALLPVVGIVASTSLGYERDERAAASIFGRKGLSRVPRRRLISVAHGSAPVFILRSNLATIPSREAA
jgi:hypothetical protein